MGGRGGRAGSTGSTECSSGGSEGEDGESGDDDDEDTDGDGEGSVRAKRTNKTKKKQANQKPTRATRTHECRVRLCCGLRALSSFSVYQQGGCVYAGGFIYRKLFLPDAHDPQAKELKASVGMCPLTLVVFIFYCAFANYLPACLVLQGKGEVCCRLIFNIRRHDAPHRRIASLALVALALRALADLPCLS